VWAGEYQQSFQHSGLFLSVVMSDLEAEPNQTVLEVHSADSAGERRSYNLCWAFFTIELKSHFRSREMVVHQNLNVTVQFMIVRVGSAGVFLLKSTIISTLWSVFSYVIIL